MKISDSIASILLSEDGRAILSTFGLHVDQMCCIDVKVVESEDLGLWIRIERGAEIESLLVRWEYILAVSLKDRTKRTVLAF